MTPTGMLPSVAVLALLAGAAPPRPADAAEEGSPVEHWARTLASNQRSGGLDYGALREDRDDLDRYLAALAGARPERWQRAERIAFWSNAYNAVVAHHVLERYPEIASVKEVAGFFDRLVFPVAGESLTLDEIEQRALSEGDPRVHFAVVCASASCPDLRAEPYVGARLEEQLEDQARRFLSDRGKGLRYDAESNTLYLSSIFKWYAGDFTGGSTVVAFFARGRVVDWIVPHLSVELARTLSERDPAVRYLDYDWSLNDRPGG